MLRTWRNGVHKRICLLNGWVDARALWIPTNDTNRRGDELAIFRREHEGLMREGGAGRHRHRVDGVRLTVNDQDVPRAWHADFSVGNQ